jgi:hypothetical protein
MQSQPNDTRADLIRTFNLLGEVKIGLLELADDAAEPTSSICREMSERIYQEQERVMALLRVREGRSHG